SDWPKGTVATYAWLEQHGVTRQLASHYRQSQWLETIGRGAFIRRGDKVDWAGGLYALQRDPDCIIHVAGKSALELLGQSHFLSLGNRQPVWLLGAPRDRLPAWFAAQAWSRPV